jgi:hypothetical protein
VSKHNKANKSNYDQAGRLAPDELAREYKKQTQAGAHATGKERVSAKAPAPRDERADTPRRNEPEE